MTLSSIYGDVVKAWLSTSNNMTEKCRDQVREDIKNELTTIDRREKDDQFPDLDEDARLKKYRTGKQIEYLVERLLKTHRNGIIKPEKTRFGLERGLVGEESSRQGERLKAANATLNAYWNPLNNAINGPIASRRKAEELRAAHELELSDIKYDGEVYNGTSDSSNACAARSSSACL